MNKNYNKLDSLKERGLDAVIAFNTTHCKDPLFYYITKSDVQGIVLYDFKKPKILTFSIEEDKASKTGLETVILNSLKHINKHIPKKIGICKRYTTAYALKILKANQKDITSDVDIIRAHKSEYEIHQIKKSCGLVKKLFSYIESNISPSITETGMSEIIKCWIANHHCDPSFSPIIAAGKNCGIPHHVPTEKRLKGTVLVDAGIKYKHYCSDCTRTYNSTHEKLIDKTIEAVFERLKGNIKCNELYATAVKSLGTHSKNFITSLGHGIGLEVHEYPNLGPSNKNPVKSSYVLTIEPGIYTKKFGIRKEHMILITEKGFTNLTNF